MMRFPFRRSRWTMVFLAPFGAGRPVAVLDGERLRVGMGIVGSASIPVSRIARVGTVDWPWWGGLGVRIVRGMTAFVASSGRTVMIDLTEPISVRAPLPWKTRRVALAVEDVDGLIEALARARRGDMERASQAP